MSLGALCLPCWDGGSIEAITEACNEAAGEQLSEAERGALDDLANDQEGKAYKHRLSPAENVS